MSASSLHTSSLHSSPLHSSPLHSSPLHRSGPAHRSHHAGRGTTATVLRRLPGALLAAAAASVDGRAAVAAVDPAGAAPRHQLRD